MKGCLANGWNLNGTFGSYRHRAHDLSSVRLSQDVEHRDPLVTAGAAQPITPNEAVAAILGSQRTNRGVFLADRTKPVAVLSCAGRCSLRATLPTAIDLAGNVDGAGLSHGDLPCSKAGAQPVSQPSAGQADTDGPSNMGSERLISQLSVFLTTWPCRIRVDALSAADRVGRTTWPRRAICVGLTTFFQISTNKPAARLRGPLEHVSERSVSCRKEP